MDFFRRDDDKQELHGDDEYTRSAPDSQQLSGSLIRTIESIINRAIDFRLKAQGC